jgi:hypothetical protein
MAIDVKTVTRAAMTVVFNLGPDLVKGATYYKPPSYNVGTGAVVTAEARATCKILVGSVPQHQIARFLIVIGKEIVLIRASELVAITAPAEGDYIVQDDGTRRDIVATPRLDPSGEFWTFETERSLNEDWGDLNTHIASEDWSDLTAPDAFEDRGALF